MDKSTKRLTVTPAPHLRDALDLRSFGLEVLIALLPAMAVAIFTYGARALAVLAAGAGGSLAALTFYALARHRFPGAEAGCALASGVLLAMLCPAEITLWLPFLGAGIGTLFGMLLMGGIAFGPWHPALTGCVLLLTAFGTEMTRWSSPRISTVCQTSMGAMRDPYLLEILQQGGTVYYFEPLPLLLGQASGTLGTTAVLALLAGGLYLLARGVIRWRVPVTLLGTVVLWAFLFPQGATLPLYSAFLHLTCGTGLFCAFFLAAMPGVAPVTAGGQLLYGFVCGLLTMAVRYFGTQADGCVYAVLCASMCVRLFDGAAHFWMHPRGRIWKPMSQKIQDAEPEEFAGEASFSQTEDAELPEEVEEPPKDESLPVEEIILSGEPGIPLPEDQLRAVHPAATAEDISAIHPVTLSVEALKTLVMEQATGNLRAAEEKADGNEREEKA